MKNILKIALTSMCMFISIHSVAELVPKPSKEDSRLLTVVYDKVNVIPLKIGLITLFHIHFSDDETILNAAVGDANAWTIIAEKGASDLFIKRKKYNNPSNLTVMTDANTYYFRLAVDNESKDPPYGLMIKSVKKVSLETPDALRTLKSGRAINTDYRFSGTPMVAPKRVYDDGQFTYFEFKTHQAIPAILAVTNRKGEEGIVNIRREGNTLIAKRLSPQWTLRNGKQVVSVFNTKMIRQVKHGKR